MEDMTRHAKFKFMSHNRQHQNNTQLLYYLLNYMDEDSKTLIIHEDIQLYDQDIPIGAALFKLLMSNTLVDMVVTMSKCGINLQQLDTFIVSVNSSTPDFNMHMKNNITGLTSRGGKSDDLIVNLF
eukprot:6220343-Ditylum_brightwellii.AAC.2